MLVSDTLIVETKIGFMLRSVRTTTDVAVVSVTDKIVEVVVSVRLDRSGFGSNTSVIV